MALHIRIDGDLVVLSNLARLMNDPRHFDASRDVRELVGQGYRKYVLELRGLPELGDSALGLVMTISRDIRKEGGEIVLAGLTGGMESYLETMQLEEYWETFQSVADAKRFFDEQEREPPA